MFELKDVETRDGEAEMILQKQEVMSLGTQSARELDPWKQK